MKIRFGNGTTLDSNIALEASMHVNRNELKAILAFCPTLNPSLIVGRPFLRVEFTKV